MLGWEEAGCAVWDAAALPDDAAFLCQHGALDMLPPLLAATAAKEEWRALDIGLGERLACMGSSCGGLVRACGAAASTLLSHPFTPEPSLHALLLAILQAGTLGNLACHPAPKAALLSQPGLPDLLLGRLLWVDDAAALAELCRCLACLLGNSDRQVGWEGRRQCSLRTGLLRAAGPAAHKRLRSLPACP